MKLSKALTLLAGCASLTLPASANAALTLGSTPCALNSITPTASSCGGWYEGNLNGGSPEMRADSAAALNALLGTTFTGATLTFLEGINASGGVVNFATPLFGDTVVAFHVGAANGQSNGVGYQSTGFFRFDAGNQQGGLNTFGFNLAGLSNARLYSTGGATAAVPEPATWAMLLLGFGAVGYSLRRKRNVRTQVSYA